MVELLPTSKPVPIVSSVMWRVERKRGKSNYGSDCEVAECVVLVPEGVRVEEAFALAKATVKRELGPEPQVETQVMGSPPRASTTPARAAPPAPPVAPNQPAPPGSKACKFNCGAMIHWSNQLGKFLNPDESPHRCGVGR